MAITNRATNPRRRDALTASRRPTQRLHGISPRRTLIPTTTRHASSIRKCLRSCRPEFTVSNGSKSGRGRQSVFCPPRHLAPAYHRAGSGQHDPSIRSHPWIRKAGAFGRRAQNISCGSTGAFNARLDQANRGGRLPATTPRRSRGGSEPLPLVRTPFAAA